MKSVLSVYCVAILFIIVYPGYSSGFSSDALIFPKESADTSANVTGIFKVKCNLPKDMANSDNSVVVATYSNIRNTNTKEIKKKLNFSYAVIRTLPGNTIYLNSPNKFKIENANENKPTIFTIARQKRNDRRQQLQAERLRKKEEQQRKRDENKRIRDDKIQRRKMEMMQRKIETQRKKEDRKREREEMIQRRKMERSQKRLEAQRKKAERIRDREAKKQRRIAEREQKKNQRLWLKQQRQNQHRVPSYQGSAPTNHRTQPVMPPVLDSWQGNTVTQRKGTNRKNHHQTKVPENDLEGDNDTPVDYNPEEGGHVPGEDNEPPISGHKRKGHVKVGVKWGGKGGDQDHDEISNVPGGGRRKGKGSVDVDVGWGGNGDSGEGIEESGGGGSGQRRKGKGHVKVGVEWGKMFGNHNGGGSEQMSQSGGHRPKGNGLFNLDIGWG